jgi:tetratricopeptide (TPR) repeat protein
VVISPQDAQVVASGGKEGQVLIWDSDSLELLKTLWARGNGIRAISFFPDGESVVVARSDKTLSIGSVMDERPKQVIKSDGSLAAVRTCLGSNNFIVIETSGTVIRYADSHAVSAFNTGLKKIDVHDISRDCRRAIAGGYGDPLTVWDLARGVQISTIGIEPSGFLEAAFLSDGDRVVLGTPDRTMELWDVNPPRKVWTSPQLPFQASAIALTASARLGVVGDMGGQVHLIDLRTVDLLRSYHGHDGSVLSISLNTRGDRAISGGSDGYAHIWPLAPGAKAFKEKSPEHERQSLHAKLAEVNAKRDLKPAAQKDEYEDLAMYWGLRIIGESLMASPTEKIEMASAGVRQFGWTPDPYLDRAHERERAGDFIGAVSDYTAALALFPSNREELASVYSSRARLLQELGENKRALQDYKRAVDLHVSDAAPFNNRVNMLLKRRDYDRAIEQYSRGITISPEVSNLWSGRGTARLRNGDSEGALADLNHARELAEKTGDTSLVPQVAHNIAQAQLTRGEIDAALQNFDESIRISNRPESIIGRGVAYLIAHRWDRAIADLERVCGRRYCIGLLILARAQLDRDAAIAELSQLSANPSSQAQRDIATSLRIALGAPQEDDARSKESGETTQMIFVA